MNPNWPDWFAALAPSTTAALGDLAVRQRFPAGSVLFSEGDPAHQVLAIQRGDVKVSTSSARGREVVLEVLGPGAILGELAALDGGRRSATAVALAPTEVLAVPSGAFREVALAHPDLLHALLMEVIARLRLSDQRQLEFGGDALGRVCARLAEIADRQGGTVQLRLPVHQSDLAAWTGLSREAVVKALAALRRLDWIETDGRSVTLLKPEEVRARAVR